MLDKLIKTLEASKDVPEAAKKLNMSRQYVYYLLQKNNKKVVYTTKLEVIDRV